MSASPASLTPSRPSPVSLTPSRPSPASVASSGPSLASFSISIPTTTTTSKVLIPSPTNAQEKRKRFMGVFKEYLMNAQSSPDPDPQKPLDVSEINKIYAEETAALETQYKELQRRVLRQQQGCCKIKTRRYSTYVSYSVTVLAAIALLGTAIKDYVSPTPLLEEVQLITYAALAIFTTLSTFLRESWISAQKKEMDLKVTLRDQLEEARVFKYFVSTFAMYQESIVNQDPQQTAKLLKKSVEWRVQLQDNVNLDRDISSFLLALPREHVLRQAFEEDKHMRIARLRDKEPQTILSTMKSMRDEEKPVSPQHPAGQLPLTHCNSAFLSHPGEGVAEPLLDRLGPLSHHPSHSEVTPLRHRRVQSEGPLYDRFGLSLKVLYANNKPYELV